MMIRCFRYTGKKLAVYNFILTILLYTFSSQYLYAANELLDSYELTPVNNAQHLRLNFLEPVSYVSHFPNTSGKILKISVRSFLLSTNREDLSQIKDIVKTKPGNAVGMKSLRLEQLTAGALTVIIEFDHVVSYKVLQDKSSKSISIYIDDTARKKAAVPAKRSPTKKISSQKYYAINLQSSPAAFNVEALKKDPLFKKYHLYTNTSVKQTGTQHNLRMGFFRSWNEARAALKLVKAKYPTAWITRIRKASSQAATNWLQKNAPIKHAPVVSKKPKKAVPDASASTPKSGSSKKIQNLMAQGKQAMLEKQYSKAYRFYKKAFKLAKGEDKKQALEFAGLARERNNQIAHAKAEYRKYLELYPQGEDSDRVRQRLEALLTARKAPKQALAKGEEKKPVRWDNFGSLYQFYRFEEAGTNQSETATVDNSLSSNLSLSSRRRSDEYDMQFRFDADHLYNDLNTKQKSKARISRMYADVTSKESGSYIRAGRQTNNNSGILGRFDGVILGKQLSNDYKLSLNMGYPVNLSETTVFQDKRFFYGLNLDVADLVKDWDFNFYTINQEADGFSDREAIGTELNIVNSTYSLFSFIDYDISYGELNTATVIANFLYGKNKMGSFNVVADYRLTPTLTTTNAVIGQTTTSLEELSKSYSEDEMRKLARDRTATYKSISVANSYPFTETIQLNADLTVTNLSATPASGNVPATESTGNEFFYSVSFIGTNLMTESDTTILAIRFADTKTSDTITYDVNTRLRLNREWRIRPRLRVDVQTQQGGTNRTIYRPSFKADYRLRRNLSFEFDMGYDYKTIASNDNNSATAVTEETGYYLSIGAIYDF